MKQEKSCGALVYRVEDGMLNFLLLRHKGGGHWSFPKGHVEYAETEEQTALREVLEETNLKIELREGFRRAVEYSPRPSLKKTVIYFLGHSKSGDPVPQIEEISEIKWMTVKDALDSVTFDNDRNLLVQAMEYLSVNGPG
jgi:bis(5'-nucleosidyl)-tetraphosphatase